MLPRQRPAGKRRKALCVANRVSHNILALLQLFSLFQSLFFPLLSFIETAFLLPVTDFALTDLRAVHAHKTQQKKRKIMDGNWKGKAVVIELDDWVFYGWRVLFIYDVLGSCMFALCCSIFRLGSVA
jgi:hypothetical protein